MLNRKEIKTDFCVVGGGIAGTVAAIAAAREGIDVVLMQERPVLGGNASSEIRMWMCGAQGENMRETGIIEEIMLNNLHRNPTKNHYIADNILLEMVLNEKNITLLLNCTCMDAETENDKYDYGREIKITKITGYQMTTQLFYDINAKFYADCSGDSILAPLTGAKFRVGRESITEHGEATSVKDSMTMGNSCLIQARETNKEVPFFPQTYSTQISEKQLENRNPNIYSEEENFWYLELGGNSDTIAQSEEIAQELRELALGMWQHIKETPKYKAENFELEFLGMLPGKRESRRYVGEYIMKQQDVSKAIKFSDTVAYGGWPLDDHFPDGFYHRGKPNTNFTTDQPYPIPYRILYSSNVDNLFFAGRNVSATHIALSSLRVMCTCGIMGQAVGTAAAICVKNSLSPHGVYEKKMGMLQNILLENDCFLPYLKREISEACLNTAVLGGDKLKNGEDRKNIIYNNAECGISVDNKKKIAYTFDQGEYVKAAHIVFNSDLDRVSLPGGWVERTHITRCNMMLDSPNMYMPKTLCKSFLFKIIFENNTSKEYLVEENIKRAYHIPIEKSVKEISLTPISNWGGTDKTDIFSFDFK